MINEKTSDFELVLDEELYNSLWLIKVLSLDPLDTINRLIAKSPLEALNCFATINPYYSEFDPAKPINLRQIVTVLIKRGSRFAFRFLDTILKPIGKIVNCHISSGREQHRIRGIV